MKKEDIRPRQVLREVGRNFPNIWKQVKSFREGKGVDLPNWADWCYLPIAAGVAIATQGDDSLLMKSSLDESINPATITAVATWKISQGVYKFDYDLYEALINQPVDDNLPCEALKRLPEYCVYIETHNAKLNNDLIDGFFAHLEDDVNTGRMELRFVFVLKDGRNIPFPIHLGNWTLDEGLKKMQEESAKHTKENLGFKLPYINITNEITPFLQLVLYLCADNMDISNKPQHPSKRVKRSGVIESAGTHREWNVGQRIGSTIRKYRNDEKLQENQQKEEESDNEGFIKTKSSPRPHIRRAHWHSYWKGPRDGTKNLIVHWIPPVPVGIDKDSDDPVVIHRVK